MKFLDLTFSTPEENLACDEASLDACEAGQNEEVLRFWESPSYFIVLGYSNKAETEVNLEACKHGGVPVLRRSSGGGTVLQGPGCLNYSLVLKIQHSADCATITGANAFIMKKHRDALQKLLGREVTIAGHTDLALGLLKFSGNAQRRKRNFFLFHGTFLLDFDLAMMEKFLALPSREPDYRQKRSHLDFLTNLNVPADAIKSVLKTVWKV